MLHSNSNTARHLFSPHHHCLALPATSCMIAHMGQAWMGTISVHAMSHHRPPPALLHQTPAHQTPSSSLGVSSPTLPTEFSDLELAMSLTTTRCTAPPTHTPPYVTLSPDSPPKMSSPSAPCSTLASPPLEGCGHCGKLVSSFHVWFKFIDYPMQP